MERMKSQMKGLKANVIKSFSVSFLKIPKVRDGRCRTLGHSYRRSLACYLIHDFLRPPHFFSLPHMPLPLLCPLSSSSQSVKDMRVGEYKEMISMGTSETQHSADVAALLEPIAPPPSTTRKR